MIKYVTWVFFKNPVSFFSGFVTVISNFELLPNWVLSVGLHFFESAVIIPYSLSEPVNAIDIETLLFWVLLLILETLLTLLALVLILELALLLAVLVLLLALFCAVLGFVWGFFSSGLLSFTVLLVFGFCFGCCCGGCCGGCLFSCFGFCFTGSFFVLPSGITSNIDIFLGGFFSSSTSPPFNLINSLTTNCKSFIVQFPTSAASSPLLSIKNWRNTLASYPLSKIFSLK